MINKMQKAIIKKDIQSIACNKRILTVLIIVPLIMAVALPCAFIIPILFSPADSPDLAQMTKLLESANLNMEGNHQYMLINLMLNYILPLFFLIIPIMASSVMASSSFVGEKEKKTLETLLYSPLPLKEIFSAKILASFLLSMSVSLFSFIVMISVIEAIALIFMKIAIIPDISWLVTMFLVSPAVSFIAISLIVRNSAKAQSSEEAQQTSLFLILPIILLIVGQFSGVMMLGTHIFLILGLVLAIIAAFTFKNSFNKFKYEALLSIMKILLLTIILATNAFSAEWYAKGKGYEKCMNTEDGFLVCREDYVNDFCYGKERMWLDRKLVAARNLNYKCEYHGWSRFRLVNNKWIWQCYLNNRAAKDEDCKGFRKR